MALHNANPISDLGVELTSVAGSDGDWLGRTCAGVCGANVLGGHGA